MSTATTRLRKRPGDHPPGLRQAGGAARPGGCGGRSPAAWSPARCATRKAPQVDLLLFITEGKPWKTGEVTVIGNPITKQQVILRQVQVSPERPLDKTALDETQRRLEDLRLFVPRSTAGDGAAAPPRRRPTATWWSRVEETNTGEINIGAGRRLGRGRVRCAWDRAAELRPLRHAREHRRAGFGTGVPRRRADGGPGDPARHHPAELPSSR